MTEAGTSPGSRSRRCPPPSATTAPQVPADGLAAAVHSEPAQRCGRAAACLQVHRHPHTCTGGVGGLHVDVLPGRSTAPSAPGGHLRPSPDGAATFAHVSLPAAGFGHALVPVDVQPAVVGEHETDSVSPLPTAATWFHHVVAVLSSRYPRYPWRRASAADPLEWLPLAAVDVRVLPAPVHVVAPVVAVGVRSGPS